MKTIVSEYPFPVSEAMQRCVPHDVVKRAWVKQRGTSIPELAEGWKPREKETFICRKCIRRLFGSPAATRKDWIRDNVGGVVEVDGKVVFR